MYGTFITFIIILTFVFSQKFKICSTEVTKQLFTSYCSSFYCALWSNFNKTSLQDLQAASRLDMQRKRW